MGEQSASKERLTACKGLVNDANMNLHVLKISTDFIKQRVHSQHILETLSL